MIDVRSNKFVVYPVYHRWNQSVHGSTPELRLYTHPSCSLLRLVSGIGVGCTAALFLISKIQLLSDNDLGVSRSR